MATYQKLPPHAIFFPCKVAIRVVCAAVRYWHSWMAIWQCRMARVMITDQGTPNSIWERLGAAPLDLPQLA